jgi:molybdopterin synthase catalytic subunit
MTVAIRIVEGPLDAAPPSWSVPGAGAVLRFEGVVRPDEEGRPIAALDYEVYEPMASRELRRLAEDLVREHGLLGIRAEHSRGRVPTGACSFRVWVAAGHRSEALAALDRFVDRLKRDVPIWKRAVALSAAGRAAAGAGTS